MVAENEEKPQKIAVTVWLVPQAHEAAEETARRHGATLPDALEWWALLMAVATWSPKGPQAALMRWWFTHFYLQKKEPPCP